MDARPNVSRVYKRVRCEVVGYTMVTGPLAMVQTGDSWSAGRCSEEPVLLIKGDRMRLEGVFSGWMEGKRYCFIAPDGGLPRAFRHAAGGGSRVSVGAQASGKSPCRAADNGKPQLL